MQRSVLASTVFLGAVHHTAAHALLEFPPLRGGTVGSDLNAWCAQCGNGAGVCGDGGQWGDSSDFLDYKNGPVTSLVAGDTVTFTVNVKAHHKGFFEFSICNKHLDSSVADAQACLDMHKLRRAAPLGDCVVNDARGDCQPIHEAHPGRWYLPPGVGTYEMRYEIPASLRCSSCTLQWRWWTANSCAPGGEATACYWEHLRSLGWNVDDWCGPTYCGTCSSSASLVQSSTSESCGEEFRNCADIAVTGEGEVATTTSSSVAATAAPGTEPEAEPETEPETTQSLTTTTTMASATTAQQNSACGSCKGCLWSNNICYTDETKSYCESWSDNLWCGESALVQVQRHGFLGPSLIQEGSVTSKGVVEKEL